MKILKVLYFTCVFIPILLKWKADKMFKCLQGTTESRKQGPSLQKKVEKQHNFLIYCQTHNGPKDWVSNYF